MKKQLIRKPKFESFYEYKIFKLFDNVWAVFFSVVISALIIWGSVLLNQKIFNSLNQQEDVAGISGQMTLIIIATVIVNIFILNNQVLKILLVFKYQHSFKGQLIFFSLLTFDYYLFAALLIKDKHSMKYFSFRPQAWKIFDYVFMAMTFALYFTFGFIASLIPQLPFFITITIKFIPLYFLAFICDWTKVLLCSVICGAFEWFFPGTFIVSVPQFLFDYSIPPIGITLAAIFKPNHEISEKFNPLDFLIFVTVPIFWVYGSRVIAGVLFWSEFPWPGFNAWTYSLVFNSINSIVDYALFISVVPIICSNLKIFKDKYQSISR